MESAGRNEPRFGRAWRAAAIVSLGLIAYLTVVCLVEGGPARLFDYEYREVSERGNVTEAVLVQRHGKHGWTLMRGIVRSGLGTHRYTFRRLRIEKYVPLWALGIDLGDAFESS